LQAVEQGFHANRGEWMFFRELRVGTGFRNGSLQRLDAFALNCYPHTGMKRICYEVKVSRGDFLVERKHPLKRRIGMRYSNEFYFVTPRGLVEAGEIPVDCGLIEVAAASEEERLRLGEGGVAAFGFNAVTASICTITVPAPWRDTPGPTWQFTAAMLRNQRREMEERPPATVAAETDAGLSGSPWQKPLAERAQSLG